MMWEWELGTLSGTWWSMDRGNRRSGDRRRGRAEGESSLEGGGNLQIAPSTSLLGRSLSRSQTSCVLLAGQWDNCRGSPSNAIKVKLQKQWKWCGPFHLFQPLVSPICLLFRCAIISWSQVGNICSDFKYIKYFVQVTSDATDTSDACCANNTNNTL